MEHKEKNLEERTYQGSLLAVMHFLSGIIAMVYSVFLVMNYRDNILFSSLVTFGILLFYLWSMYASISRYKEGNMGVARGIFTVLGGLFLVFFLNIMICAYSVGMS